MPVTRPKTQASARDQALTAAAAILGRDGYQRLTIERIAAESGVAKTTLYRHWPTLAAICIDVYLQAAERELGDPDTGDVAEDLKVLVNEVVRLQTRTAAGPALMGLFAEAQLDPSTPKALLAEFADRRRHLSRVILRRAVRRKQIRSDIDIELLIDMIGGATTFRLLQGHAPLNRKFADSLVELALSGAR